MCVCVCVCVCVEGKCGMVGARQYGGRELFMDFYCIAGEEENSPSVT